MTLWILGAHNRTNLQRRSIRWLIGDECWRWPQGHMAEAEARVTAFGWLGKCLFMSQAGEEGDDTHRKYETTDQRDWTFACPRCALRQPFKWENIEWSKSARDEHNNWDYEEVKRTTVLVCEGCGNHFEDNDRTRRELNATGRFVATNPKAASENVGFHWNALTAMGWGRLAELYLRAKAVSRQGDFSLLKQFYQKRLAIPWREFTEDYKLEIERTGYRKGELWESEAALDKSGRIVPGPYEANAVSERRDRGATEHLEELRRFVYGLLRRERAVERREKVHVAGEELVVAPVAPANISVRETHGLGRDERAA
jgi:phage terminase large subunit GpA-like protein